MGTMQKELPQWMPKHYKACTCKQELQAQVFVRFDRDRWESFDSLKYQHVDLKGTTTEKEGVVLGGAMNCGPRCWEPVTTLLLSEDMNWGRPFTSPTLLHCTGFQCKLPRGYGQQPGLVIKLPSWRYRIVLSVVPLLLLSSHTVRQSCQVPSAVY